MGFLPLLLFLFQDAATFRADVSLVHVDVEVRQDQKLVEALTTEDFRITDNGRPMPVLYLGHQEEHLDIVLLLDTSASMRPVMERVADATRAALGQLRGGDRVAVMAFDRDPTLIADFSSDFEAVERSIREKVLTRSFPMSTHIQEAVDVAARHFLTKSGERGESNRRRAVLIITDNMGIGSDGRAVPDLWEADAVLSGIIVKNPRMAVQYSIFFPPSLLGIGGMTGIAEKTGGDAVKPDDAGEGLKQMIQRLRLRYSLYYAAPAARAGEERKIKVELTGHKGAKIRARSGYRVAK
jgi:VWFA-related protein